MSFTCDMCHAGIRGRPLGTRIQAGAKIRFCESCLESDLRARGVGRPAAAALRPAGAEGRPPARTNPGQMEAYF